MTKLDTTDNESIINRMKDCGNGRHIGWWSEKIIDHIHLLIEVRGGTLSLRDVHGDGRAWRVAMICQTCHGTGKAFVSIRPRPNMTLAESLVALNAPCPTRQGCGITSCCDAAGSAQPEEESDD